MLPFYLKVSSDSGLKVAKKEGVNVNNVNTSGIIPSETRTKGLGRLSGNGGGR